MYSLLLIGNVSEGPVEAVAMWTRACTRGMTAGLATCAGIALRLEPILQHGH